MTQFDEALLQVMNDKQSGSVAVVQQLIRAILSFLIREEDPGKSLKTVHDRLPLMKGALGHFAVVDHFLKALDDAIEHQLYEQISQEALFDFVRNYDETWKNANARVAKCAFESIDCHDKTVLLHSNSSVITSFFQHLKNRNVVVNILQTESRPENEGRYQARKLADLGFQVNFVVDAAAAFMMDKVDIMLSGADQIHSNYFVNKIGTYALALLCREKQIPLHILADSRKISGTSADIESLYNIRKDGVDVWKESHDNIHPINYYFEAVPSALVASVITEKDCLLSQHL